MSTTPPRPESNDITQEQFDRLLGWLDPERDQAAARYEWIRKRLIKIFVSRGSHTPEDLADKTINRVARKLPDIQAGYTGDPSYYFVGVAVHVFLESVRKERAPVVVMPRAQPISEDDERDQSCLEECLEKLTAEDRDLVRQYYQHERQAKIDDRKELAQRLGVSMNALRIRACRIRAALQDCVEKCRSEA